jgi:hypothetical protein
MPYTKKQEAAFRAAAHDPATRKAMGMTEAEARMMMRKAKAHRKPKKTALHGE